MLKYERTLKYVEFPSLDMMAESREGFKESTYLKTTHREVFQILEWLNVKKGVQKIIKLVVPDRLVNPHDELEMAWYVNQFQVEVLDWKTLDLSISAFQNPLPPKRLKQTEIETSATAAIRIKPTLGKTLGKSEKKKPTEHLRELSLYSSGRRAAVYHWFNRDDGIPSLKARRLFSACYVLQTSTELEMLMMVHSSWKDFKFTLYGWNQTLFLDVSMPEAPKLTRQLSV